jgi:GDP-4-dehydro-6-deoxy-D-mannose reductase
MKYVITGHSGFVGQHFIKYLLSVEPDAMIMGIDIATMPHPAVPGNFNETIINLLDREKVDAAIAGFKPDFLLHLASFSSVAFSWKEPYDSFLNNMTILLNVLESVRKFSPACRILSIGSSEEYGIVDKKDLPLTETRPFNPASPYAVARVSQEYMSMVYVNGYKLDIICTRSFNHIGIGQDRRFVVGAIAGKVAEFVCGKISVITTGDTAIVRDFIDVRDVVRAYYMLFKQGTRGQIYNVCSGNGHTISDIIKKFTTVTGCNPEIKVDPELLRPVENRIVVGANDKIRQAIGWEPQIKIDDSIKDIAAWWINKIKNNS